MATESLGGLYLRLGLSLSELESDFIAAENSIRQNIANLNRESTLISLRADVDIGNLDATTDAVQILSIREEALNKQLEIQRDKIKLATAALNDIVQKQGEHSYSAQKAESALKREELTLQRLQRELKGVKDAQQQLNSQQSAGGNFLSSAYGALKGNIPGQITDFINSFDKLKSVTAAVAALAALPVAIKAGDNNSPMIKMLERFGAQVRDSNGRIKDEIGLIQELSKAWKNALDAGESAKFRDVVGGKFWSGDFITFLEDYKDNVAAAANIVRNGLFNPTQAHGVQGLINAMNTQAEQLGGAFSSALMPVAESLVPKITERMGELTKVIAQNADGIKNAGQVAADVIGSISDAVAKATATIIKLTGKIGTALVNLKALNDAPVNNDIVERYVDDKDVKSLDDLFNKELQRNSNQVQIDSIKASPTLPYQLKEQLRPTFDELKKLREESEKTGKALKDLGTELDALNWRALKGEKFKTSEELEEIQKSVKTYRDLSDELYKLTHNDFENKIFDIQRRHRELFYSEKNIADIQYSLTHSAFEKQLRDIEQWKQAQLEKADTAEKVAATIQNAAMKEAEAFEREMDRIKGTIQSAQDRLARLTMSQKDYDKYSAEKEYKQDIKNGVPKEIADAIYDARMKEIKSRAIKGGDYVKTPAGGRNSNYSEYFRDFTPKTEDKNKRLIDLDADALAYDAALEKSKKAVEEFGNSLDKSKGKTDEIINGADSFNQSLDAAAGTIQNADSSLSNLDGTVKGTVDGITAETDNFRDKISQNADALNDASTAAGTFEQALENIQDIREQNSLQLPMPNFPSPPATDSGYRMGIIKGTDIAQVNSDLISQSSDVVNSITPAFEQIETAAQDLSLSIADAAPSISSAIFEQTEGISAGISSVSGALSGLTAGTDSVSSALQNTAATLENVNQRISNINFQPSQQQPAQQPNQPNNQMPNLSPEVVNTAFNVVSAIGDIAALSGVATGNVPIALLGTGVSAFANAANTGYDVYNLKNDQQPNPQQNSQLNSVNADINAAIERLSIPLQELSQRTGDIATSVETIKQQKPTINVSPTVNVNLGGAYVFDDAMKAKLTDDVSNEVVQAVTDAFEQALNQSSYGYGN